MASGAGGGRGARAVRVRVEFSPDSVRVVRGRLDDWMSDIGLPASAKDDARLVLSELLTNAVEHATPLPDGRLVVTWARLGKALTLSVRDGGGPNVPRALDPPPLANAGRGLGIVATLAEARWVEGDRYGRTVHALVPLP